MCLFFFKQKTAYELATLLEFRRVLFRSNAVLIWRPAAPDSPGLSQREAVADALGTLDVPVILDVERSEERRVGKGCRSRWLGDQAIQIEHLTFIRIWKSGKWLEAEMRSR